MAVQEQTQAGSPWWDAFPVTQSFGQNGETGTDYGTPFHTPISTPFGGTVTGTSYGLPGGEVFVQTTLPSGQRVTEAIVHLDQILVKVGQQLNPGELVGLSGGQNVGGAHPASPAYSSGAHTELDFFTGAPFGSPSLNPVTILRGIFGPVSQPAVSQASSPAGSAALNPLWQGILSGIGINTTDQSQTAGSVKDTLWRGGLIVFGAVLIIVGILIFFRQPIEEGAGTVIGAAAKAK